jgi:hypothetical protein
VDGDGAGRGFAVETAHVAVRIVEAHEPVDLGHRGKRLVDRLLQVVPMGAGRGNLDKSAEQRLRSPNAIGDVRTRPKFASRLRSRASRKAGVLSEITAVPANPLVSRFS